MTHSDLLFLKGPIYYDEISNFSVRNRAQNQVSHQPWDHESRCHDPRADDAAPGSKHHVSLFKIPTFPHFLHKSIACF